MPLEVPQDRVYYYELRECGNVLLCWLPPGDLAALVASGGVKAEILEDHPDGLDLEVTPGDFRYHAKRYDLDLGHKPEALLLAFEAIRNSAEVEDADEVLGAMVEEFAERGAGEGAYTWNARRPVSLDQVKAVLHENPAVQRRVDEALISMQQPMEAAGAEDEGSEERAPEESAPEEAAPPPEVAGGGPKRKRDRLPLPRIRKTKGDPDAKVFRRLEQRARKGS